MSCLPTPAARVAIVDSRPSDYDNVLMAAGDADVSVHFMRTGSEALRFLRRWHAGLWVINTRLDDMSGFDLAQMLRGMRPNALIFIIGEEYRLDDEMQTLTLGLTKYVCKPLEASWVIPQGDDVCIPFRVFHEQATSIGPADSEAEEEAIDILPSGLGVIASVGSEAELGSDEMHDSVAEHDEPMIIKFDPQFRRRGAA